MKKTMFILLVVFLITIVVCHNEGKREEVNTKEIKKINVL